VIASLKAQIEVLEADIAELNTEIAKLSKQISEINQKLSKKQAVRNKENAKYMAKAKDMNEAIAACGAAIDALKNAKSSLKGAKVDLTQLTSELSNAISKQASMVQAASSVSFLNGKPAPKFEYQSNDIIATLEDLLAEFKGMKRDLDIEEHDANFAFEKNTLGLRNERKFAMKDKAQKETIVEHKTEQLNAAKSDLDQELNDRKADDAFFKELQAECEKKAELFDARSNTRADELSALDRATKELQAGAVPNFEANEKLVDLQKGKSSKVVSSPPVFAQISEVRHTEAQRKAVLRHIQNSLSGAADRSGSQILLTLAVRIGMSEDHFVKVRSLIKDLIAKLKSDALAEESQKSFCDEAMAKNIGKRDAGNAQVEKANAAVTTLTARKHALEDEIATLNSQIAELKKGLLEATELRNEEKAKNERMMQMAQAGADSVELALTILREFYDKSFMQTRKYVPPGSNRDGKTVQDLAPDTGFDSKYTGAKEESKGIVGILEVILTDFERSKVQAKADDAESLAAFESMESDTNEDVKEKNDRIKAAEAELDDAEAGILEQTTELNNGQSLLDGALDELASLEAMCVKGEETWEERKQKREEEIEALKAALEILENWQG